MRRSLVISGTAHAVLVAWGLIAFVARPSEANSDDEAPEVVSQRAKPERGRYLLQVDRQTKGSFQDICSIGWPRNQSGLSHPSRGNL